MSKAVVAGICVGIIAGISTTAVLSEVQAPSSAQAVTQALSDKTAETPVLASVAKLTQSSVVARPAPTQAAGSVPGETLASTDGRRIESAVDRAVAAAAAAAAAVTAASAPSANTQAASTPAPAPAVAAAPAAAPAPAVAAAPAAGPAVRTAEPAVKPVSPPQHVVRKRYRRPSNYSRNQNPFFNLFGGGNGFFFGGRRG